jgi:hypothetical protein
MAVADVVEATVGDNMMIIMEGLLEPPRIDPLQNGKQ